MQYRYSRYQKEINLLGDLISLNLFYLACDYFFFNDLSTLIQSNYFNLQLIYNLAWITSSFIVQVHDTTRTVPFEIIIRRLINALGLLLLIVFAILGIKGDDYNKNFILLSYVVSSVGISSFHVGFLLFLKYYRRIGYNYRRVAVAGYGDLAKELRKFFIFHPEHGYKFYGYFDDLTEGPQIKGKVHDLKEFSIKNKIDEIYCCLPAMKNEDVKEIVDFAEDNFIKVKLIPDYRGFPYKGVEVQLYDYIPVLKLRPQPLDDPYNRFIKRTFDILFSLAVIIFILSWLMPIVAILIRLDSRGPVFFRQLRHGKDNATFNCIKFRTMVQNKESDIKQATKNDPRITPLGKFLRRTSIDELPQFINVLIGDMSVIGPRPHPLNLNYSFSDKIDKFMLRHSVKPGITGLAQAKGYRGETSSLISMRNRVKLDKFYVENWSMLFDIKITFLTIATILNGHENAY